MKGSITKLEKRNEMMVTILERPDSLKSIDIMDARAIALINLIYDRPYEGQPSIERDVRWAIFDLSKWEGTKISKIQAAEAMIRATELDSNLEIVNEYNWKQTTKIRRKDVHRAWIERTGDPKPKSITDALDEVDLLDSISMVYNEPDPEDDLVLAFASRVSCK